ncbi:MAG TPA: diaminobutyrate acetyltransferase [Gammaproteobacteria bacterium]|jgi:diaminobutyrate acetyltransferase|nr:diaminobutyrate acetyltransferase [Gammaproteobacteria bacterium]
MPDEIRIRQATAADGAAMWRLAGASGVLELNSAYCYLLIAKHFGDTCMVAEGAKGVAGFVMAYRPPPTPAAVFVWQIGVAKAARGQGIAGRLLDAVAESTRAEYLEASVATGNRASQALFRSFARRHGAPLDAAADFLNADDFPGEHETEKLFRIGPLSFKG